MRVEHRALPVDQVDTTIAAAVRTEHNDEVPAKYAERMNEGDQFPAIEVFVEVVEGQERYWCWDGQYRCAARKIRQDQLIEARCAPGSRADAVWASYSSNTRHGEGRTTEDTRRIIEEAVKSPRAKHLSDGDLARHLGVSRSTIQAHRSEMGLPTLPRGRYAKDAGRQAPEKPPEPDSEEESAPPQVVPAKDEFEDAVGKVIPARLHSSWKKKAWVQGIRTSISTLKGEITKLCNDPDLGRHLHKGMLTGNIEELSRAMRYAEPYALCPYCGGKGCQACRQDGWVGKPVFDQAAKEGTK